jgi:DNA-binding GntR family transcriptional regulator
MANLPLAALGTVIFDRNNMEREHDRMMLGVLQHQIIFKAIVEGDSLRAEAVSREHSHATLDYEDSFVDLYADPVAKDSSGTAK